jgi:hypothetical protein
VATINDTELHFRSLAKNVAASHKKFPFLFQEILLAFQRREFRLACQSSTAIIGLFEVSAISGVNPPLVCQVKAHVK